MILLLGTLSETRSESSGIIQFCDHPPSPLILKMLWETFLKCCEKEESLIKVRGSFFSFQKAWSIVKNKTKKTCGVTAQMGFLTDRKIFHLQVCGLLKVTRWQTLKEKISCVTLIAIIMMITLGYFFCSIFLLQNATLSEDWPRGSHIMRLICCLPCQQGKWQECSVILF